MTLNKLAVIISSVIVLVAVITGFALIGSPVDERLRRLDEHRIDDLRRLFAVISEIYVLTDSLPDSLEDLVNGRQLSQLPTDPESGAMYHYEVIAPASFRLCAGFSSASASGVFWSHGAGLHCFTLSPQARR